MWLAMVAGMALLGVAYRVFLLPAGYTDPLLRDPIPAYSLMALFMAVRHAAGGTTGG